MTDEELLEALRDMPVWPMEEAADRIEAQAEAIEDCRLALKNRVRICWEMANVFLQNQDPHGLHDMGVEIQALQCALRELEQLEKAT